MLGRFKFVKPQGIHLPHASSAAGVFGCVLAICVFGGPSFAAQEKAACEQELTPHLKVIENLKDGGKEDPEQIDDGYLTENCHASDRSLVDRENGYKENPRDTAAAGACRSAHGGILRHYQELKRTHAEYCDAVEDSGKALDKCLDPDSKEAISSCLTELRTNLKDIQSKYKKVRDVIDEGARKLTKLKEKNSQVSATFISDRNAFLRGEARIDSNSCSRPLSGARGFEADLSEYKGLVAPDAPANVARRSRPSEGALIEEQRLAGENIVNYLKGLNAYKSVKANAQEPISEQIGKLSKKANENKSAGNDWSKYVGPAAATAPAAQSLLQKSSTRSAAASGPGISGAVAALPVAVALAGAAKSASGASAAAPGSPAGSAPAARETPTTSLGEAAAGARGPAAADTNELKAATEPRQAEEAATGGYSPVSLSSDGSSRMGALKKGAKATEESHAPAEAANYANPGFDAGGGASLSSHGGSRSPSPAPGTEVTNLLGQMKSLFNFDDPAPGGGGVFGGAMPAMSPVGLPAGEEPALAGDFGTGADGAGYPDPVAADPDDTPYEAGALPDNQPDSLFARVHKRHRRCVERGLVVANLGGLR